MDFCSEQPTAGDLSLDRKQVQKSSPRQTLDESEARTIREAMARCRGNLTLVARELGISRILINLIKNAIQAEARHIRITSGIGLSLSRQIMLAHNGRLDLVRSDSQCIRFALLFR